MSIQIIKAKEIDIPQIDEVLLDTWLRTYPSMLGILRRDIISFFGTEAKRIEGIRLGLHQKSVTILVAKHNKKVVGVCFGYIKEKSSIVKGLYVNQESQGRGIGKRLLKEFEKRNSLPVELHVLSKNVAAQDFYKSQEYRDTKKYRYFVINKKRFRDNLYIKMKL